MLVWHLGKEAAAEGVALSWEDKGRGGNWEGKGATVQLTEAENKGVVSPQLAENPGAC